jgi:hypothetical protein
MRQILLGLVFVQPALVVAWNFTNNVNFEHCFELISNKSILDPLNKSDTINQVFPLDPKTGAEIFTNRTLLTLSGCERFCHNGFDLWSWNEILARIILWVVPAIVLVTRFHFAPLSGTNTIRVILHLLGDPIDSIWSMLVRQEVNRRLMMRASINTGVTNVKAAVATIWAAYDEIGWINPAEVFEKTLSSRMTTGSNENLGTRSEDSNIQHQSDASISVLDGGQHDDSSARHKEAKLDDFEEYYILLAAQRITSNRSESNLTTLVAIAGLISALIGAFIRTWSNRLNNQTSHTIAVVSLFFIFIPVVWISSNIGAFNSPTDVIDIIQELRRNLKKHNASLENLFPAFSLHEDLGWKRNESQEQANKPQKLTEFWNKHIHSLLKKSYETLKSNPHSDSNPPAAGMPDSEDIRNLRKWPQIAGYMGMNSCWRPDKSLPVTQESKNDGRSRLTLLAYPIIFVWGCSYVPALLLSFFTPLVGFACRSLAWTIIVVLWTLAPVLGFFLRLGIKSAKRLWLFTTLVDLFNFFGILFIVSLAQVGVFNSCYCRSGALTKKNSNENYVNLYPLTDEEFNGGFLGWGAIPTTALVVMGLIFYNLGSGSYSDQMPLNKTITEKANEITAVNRKRESLWQSTDIRPRSSQNSENQGTPINQRMTPADQSTYNASRSGEDIEMV